MIYFDNASTTIPSKEVLEEFTYFSNNFYANANSVHSLGMKSESMVARIKENILKELKLNSSYDIIFTSGATESNNLAIRGYVLKYLSRGRQIITTKIEHESVLNVFKDLENKGFIVKYLDVTDDGKINLNELKKLMNTETILVSIMGVNNEVGNIFNLEEVKNLISIYPKCKFHSDLVQAVGKSNINFSLLDMFTLSGHKIHGLKGIGVLVKKKSIDLEPIIYGGEQQNNYRSGTLDLPNIAAFNVALKIALKNYAIHKNKIKEIHDYLINSLKNNDEIEINSRINWCPYIVSFSLKSKKASVVIEALSNEGIYVNGVSACNSKKLAPSYVLQAFKKDLNISENSIRISLSNENSLLEAEVFINTLNKVLKEIKEG